VVDRFLRPAKRRLLAPLGQLLKGVDPQSVTLLGVVAGFAAALSAALGAFPVALLLWWLNRILDGLDGELARLQRSSVGSPNSDTARGGYLDLMADLLSYSLLPIGIAIGLGEGATLTLGSVGLGIWPLAALLLASFYLNLGSWALLGPLLTHQQGPLLKGQQGLMLRPRTGARPGQDARDRDAPAIHLPSGLIEGTETLLLFSVALAFPQLAPATLALFALLTFLSALQRTLWGLRTLKGAE
jgi:hypothetical protein